MSISEKPVSKLTKGKAVLIDPIPTKKDADVIVRNSADFTTGSPVAVREPIAIEHIGAYLKTFGYEVEIIAQGSKSNEQLAQVAREHAPDIVGLSMHSTYLCSHTIDLAQRIKTHLRSTPIAVGGYHPSGYFDIAKDKNIDYIVIGEGEETLRQLMDKIVDGGNAKNVSGIAYFNGDTVIVNNPQPRLDFASLPWAMRNMEILRESKCTPLAYPAPPKQASPAQIAYSRGCPHLCSFCASPLIWGSKLSYREPKDVVDEILHLQKTFGTNFLFFNDLSFNVNKKKVVALCKEMMRRVEGVSWFAYTTIHGMDYKTAKMMRDAGCTRLGFGIESVLDPTLDKIKPRQHFEDIRRVLEMTDRLGMLNRCYMLIGWPWESKETLEETSKRIRHLNIDQLRLSFVIPFPGTKFYDEQKHRIVVPFEEFSGDKPVMPSEHLTIEELKSAATELFSLFYSSKEYKRHVDEKVRRYPHLENSFGYFFNYLKRHGIIR